MSFSVGRIIEAGRQLFRCEGAMKSIAKTEEAVASGIRMTNALDHDVFQLNRTVDIVHVPKSGRSKIFSLNYIDGELASIANQKGHIVTRKGNLDEFNALYAKIENSITNPININNGSIKTEEALKYGEKVITRTDSETGLLIDKAIILDDPKSKIAYVTETYDLQGRKLRKIDYADNGTRFAENLYRPDGTLKTDAIYRDDGQTVLNLRKRRADSMQMYDQSINYFGLEGKKSTQFDYTKTPEGVEQQIAKHYDGFGKVRSTNVHNFSYTPA